MKALLKLFNVRNTLGVNIFQIKTLTKWLSELSQKSHFLHLLWQPAYSYGLTTPAPRMLLKSQAVSEQGTVIQDQQFGQIAELTQQKKKNNNNKLFTSVVAGRSLNSLSESIKLDGLKVRLFNGLYTFWDNKRLRWGMLTLLIIAPLTKFAYLLFPAEGFGEYFINAGSIQIANTIEGLDNGWYYLFFKDYFFSIGELMAPILSMFGIFLLFPKKYYPSYLVGVPFGYYFSMLVHRMFFVTDFNSFHNGFQGSVMIMFLLMGVTFFIISDKVMFKQNHRKRAAEARIVGLVNMPGMSWNDKEDIIRKEVAEVMKVDNELFIKESA